MINSHADAIKHQRIINKLNRDVAKAKNDIDENRVVSRSILLGRILGFMRKRHQDDQNTPMTLNQMLTGTDQQYIGWDDRYWLYTVGLPDHQKMITVYNGLRFKYKPTYNIKNRSELLGLLKKVYDESKGGILLEHIIESLPNAEKILGDNPTGYVTLTRLADKKKTLFYGEIAKDMANIRFDMEISSKYVPLRKVNEKKSGYDLNCTSSHEGLTNRADSNSTITVPDSKHSNVFKGFDESSCLASGYIDPSYNMQKSVIDLLKTGDGLLFAKNDGAKAVVCEPEAQPNNSNETDV